MVFWPIQSLLVWIEHSPFPQHPRADAETAPYMIIWDSLSDDLPFASLPPLWNTISMLFEFQLERLERGGRCCETEVKGDSKSTIKGVLSWLVRWACRACVQYSALAALVGPVKYFYPRRTLFQFLCPPSLSKLGKQSCWVACLLVCVSGSSTKCT
jgi:hypothetical protein